MSIAANNMIKNELQDKLKDVLTVSLMDTVLESIDSILSGYDIVPVIIEDGDEDILLDAYINAMSVEGKSKKTLERYKYVIGRFLKDATTSTRNITQYHIRRYLSDEKERGVADSTIRSYCWVFSAYFGWLHRDGLIPRNPMGNIGNIKVQKKVKEVFTEIEIEKLKSACETLRDKAIVCFLKSTGCRISEVTNLNVSDIDFNNLECIVLGKGNKQRTVYIDAVTGMILQNYLNTRKETSEALFASVRNQRLQPNGVRIMLRKLGERAGVEHVHPHKFRRTEISELVGRGMSIEQVKELAGHEKIDTTMGYVVLKQQNIKSAYQKYA